MNPKEIQQKSVSSIIKQLNEDYGIRIRFIASELGIHYRTIDYWLRGKNISDRTFNRCFPALNLWLKVAKQVSFEIEKIVKK